MRVRISTAGKPLAGLFKRTRTAGFHLPTVLLPTALLLHTGDLLLNIKFRQGKKRPSVAYGNSRQTFRHFASHVFCRLIAQTSRRYWSAFNSCRQQCCARLRQTYCEITLSNSGSTETIGLVVGDVLLASTSAAIRLCCNTLFLFAGNSSSPTR